MTGSAHATLMLLCLLTAAACKAPRDEDLAALNGSESTRARTTRLENALAGRDTNTDRTAPIARWVLPRALKEISGLALTSDGRMLVHGDEFGQVWEIDYRRGVLVKRFFLGDGLVKGDFEAIAIVNDVVWLLASNGKLYEFREGANEAHVDYKVHDTGLKQACEFEGLAYDPAINSLLLACKHIYDKSVRDALLIYRWRLAADSGAMALSQLTVPIAGVGASYGWKTLHPSDITVDPLTGNYVLIASNQKAIISITPAGAVVFARPLPPLHDQPEGVAITKDGILIVSDEAVKGPALVTLYRWP